MARGYRPPPLAGHGTKEIRLNGSIATLMGIAAPLVNRKARRVRSAPVSRSIDRPFARNVSSTQALIREETANEATQLEMDAGYRDGVCGDFADPAPSGGSA